MNKNLLIIGAGIYGIVAKEIAESMMCFDNIAFADDTKSEAPNGTAVIGTTADLDQLLCEFNNVIVAIGNPRVRLDLIHKLDKIPTCNIATLISPHAYVSPSADISRGSIIEPMAVIHACCIIGTGCIVSAGAVLNHASRCLDGVHVDCNATVAGFTSVPEFMKICSGEVFDGSVRSKI